MPALSSLARINIREFAGFFNYLRDDFRDRTLVRAEGYMEEKCKEQEKRHMINLEEHTSQEKPNASLTVPGHRTTPQLRFDD
ncbi:hypothetical protein CC1G_13981 [Coprinopsis cinerea okayama7|uniref:Uncharacterized protein n=1 Tax=Coprinopsis cinerea (strain Okayama-7 / 130 / ATCC MYA-4618 / FGSC 9003) TaxID=240176 RepID=D6RKS0_COPC7|nr:hypothetical protein CC1G_13981 [Coprinopsis cinerea okayama7\|eukprot:XP_002911942.1 hypothetical protein CC1G_13981 [Coprinopsis cinerea okayama7\